MTEKEAYLLSLNLWLWLYHNPGQDKKDSPFWENVKLYTGECPLCELIKNPCCYGCLGNQNKRIPCFDGAWYEWHTSDCNNKPAAAYIASNIRRYCRKKGWVE